VQVRLNYREPGITEREPKSPMIASPYGQKTEPTDGISRRLSMVIAQEPAQSLAAPHWPLALPIRHPRKQQDVALPLMIPLSVEMVDVALTR
jgi:hypothetical protein